MVGGRGEEKLAGYVGQTAARLQGLGWAVLVTVHGHHGVVDRDGWSCWKRENITPAHRNKNTITNMQSVPYIIAVIHTFAVLENTL